MLTDNGQTYTANAVFQMVSYTASTNPIALGSTQVLTATVIGGNTPYTYNFLVYNSLGLVANALYTGVSSTTNTFTFTQNSIWGTGTFTYNLIVTDNTPISITDNGQTYTASSAVTCVNTLPAPSTVPSGIVAYVPVVLCNEQPSATEAPFQQQLTVNSLNYTSYEAGGLTNVEFFYSNGIIDNSWLETNNSNTATSSIYWLNLANGIAANTNSVVYIGFAPLSTTLLNNAVTGEAPNMSTSYSQYDDGANVFNLYDNFAGTTLNSSKWLNKESAGGSVTVSNGITFATAATTDYTWLYSNKLFTSPQYVDTYLANQVGTTLYDIGFADSNTAVSSAKSYPFNSYDLRYYSGAEKIGVDTNTIHTTAASVITSFLQGVWQFTWAATGNQFGIEQNNQISATNTLVPFANYYAFFGLETSATTTGSDNANWISVRAYPPANVMPNTIYAPLVTVSSSVLSIASYTASNNPIDGNQFQVLSVSTSNGVSSNTLTYSVYNSVGLVTNMIYSGVTSASNTFTFAQNAVWGTGPFTYNLVVTSGSSTATDNGQVYNAYGVGSVSYTASNNPIDQNQYQTLTASVTGDNAPFTYNFLVYNSLGLVDNALYSSVASGTKTFTFQQSPSWGTGPFTYNLIVTDNAQTHNVLTSNSNAYSAYGVGSVSYSAHNTLIDANQIQVLTAQVTGDNAPFTYNFLVYNSVGLVTNALYSSISSSTNTFTFTENQAWSSGPTPITFNLIVTDSAQTHNVLTSNSNIYSANNIGAITSYTASNNPVGFNGNQVLTATISGDTASYTYNFLVYNSLGLVDNALYITTSTTNTFKYVQSSSWGTGTFTYNLIVTDSATTKNVLTYNGQTYSGGALCFIQITNSLIGFGSLNTNAQHATSNQVIDSNPTSTVSSNILTEGTNWVFGANSFAAYNTVWNPTPSVSYVGNILYPYPNNLIDTGIIVPTAGSNDIYFGVGIPPGEPPGPYSQNIILENSC